MLVKNGTIEPLEGAQGKPYSIEDLLDKAETLHIDGFVPGMQQLSRPTQEPQRHRPERASVSAVSTAIAMDGHTDPVIVAVGRHFSVRSSDLLTNDGRQELELPRKVAMYVFAAKDVSFARIAEMFSCTSSEVEAAWKLIKMKLLGDEQLRKFVLAVALGVSTKTIPQGSQRSGSVAHPVISADPLEPRRFGRRRTHSNVDTAPYFRVVVEHYKVSPADLYGGQKGASPASQARRSLMWLLRQAGMVVREIAEALRFSSGGVNVGLRDLSDQLDSDAQLKEVLRRLRERAESASGTTQESTAPEVRNPVVGNAPVVIATQVENNRAIVSTAGAMTEVAKFNSDQIINTVCEEYGIKKENLFKTTSDWRYNDARRVVMLLLQEQGMSSSKIGKLVNEKDTDVFIAIQTIRSRLKGDVALRTAIKNIKSKLEASSTITSTTNNSEVTHASHEKAPKPTTSQSDQVDTERYAMAVMQEFKIEEDALYSPSKPVEQLAQQVFILLMREEKLLFSDITKLLGITGTAAFMHLQALERRLKADDLLQDRINAIKSSLKTAHDAVEQAHEQEPDSAPFDSATTESEKEVAEQELAEVDSEPMKDESNEKERDVRRAHFIKLPHYQRWLEKVSILDSYRVLRALTPIWTSKPVKDPQLLGLLTTMTRDEWVETLQDSCAEYLDWNNIEIGFVAHFAEVVPLPQVLLEYYVQDERIVQLQGRRTKGDQPSKHLLVFSTLEEARHARLNFDTPSEW